VTPRLHRCRATTPVPALAATLVALMPPLVLVVVPLVAA
jgi:hypothetical protein